MGQRTVLEVLRKDWYFALAFAICVGAVCFKLVVYPPADTNDEGATTVPSQGVTPQQPGTTGAASSLNETMQRPVKTEREKALEVIGEHQKKIEADRESEDAPALYAAMGNLYRLKVQDYKEAARCYELLLIDYPNWSNIRSVYVQLATCYEKLGDRKGVERIYKRMMAEFPKESQEYQYAEAKLAGKLPAAP